MGSIVDRRYAKGRALVRHEPGTIIQASDRRYIVHKDGSLRVLDYRPAPPPETPVVEQLAPQERA